LGGKKGVVRGRPALGLKDCKQQLFEGGWKVSLQKGNRLTMKFPKRPAPVIQGKEVVRHKRQARIKRGWGLSIQAQRKLGVMRGRKKRIQGPRGVRWRKLRVSQNGKKMHLHP